MISDSLSTRRQILKQRLARAATASDQAGARMTPERRAQNLPLSYAQQRFWFEQQLEPASPLHNASSTFLVSGRLHVEALRRAIQAVVARHEILHTTYAAVNGEPFQQIQSDWQLAVPLHVLSHTVDRNETLAAQLAAATAQPFDLERDLPLRAAIFRLDDEEFALSIVDHHIASDYCSRGVFLRELSHFYRAFHRGETPALPELPFQYADYALSQRQQEESAAMRRHLDYWRERLRGAPSQTRLPVDRPGAASFTHASQSLKTRLDPDLTKALYALCQEHRTTLFTLLLAALQTLLKRYSGQEDIIVGAPMTIRHSAETRQLIGCFINTLPMRMQLIGNPTFRQLLSQAQETVVAALTHSDAPFERIVQEADVRREDNRAPLAQTLLNFLTHPQQELMLDGLTVTPIAVPIRTGTFDLTLTVVQDKPHLDLSLSYNAEAIDPDRAERLLQHCITLLESIVANPDRGIDEINILPDAERNKILVAWNDTAEAIDYERSFPDWFADTAGQWPDHSAILHDGKVMSYAELDALTNQIAQQLQALGVRPEVIVGMLFERNPWYVVAMVAIAKAGGAMLPLDPRLPPARLQMMLADAAAAVLLTERALFAGIGDLPLDSGVEIIVLDTDNAWRQQDAATRPRHGLTPEHMAAVIFTSGSTGKPKGVVIEHRSLSNYHAARLGPYGPTVARTMFLDGLGSDTALGTVLGSLLARTTVILPAADVGLNPDELIDLILEHDLERVDANPNVLAAMARSPRFAQCHTLRIIVFGGEAMPVPLKEELMARFPVRIFNGYGPTEVTVTATVYECRAGAWEQRIPIGSPIANVTAYILDERMQPAPIGVPGEIYLGGAQVARGYLNDPDLTAARFLPDPFSASPQARMYRTGDMGRWLASGEIDFLGRVDNQIKIRGNRVELEEIEIAILQHPAVAQAVAQVRGEGESLRIIAFVSFKTASVSAEMLRGCLAESLPDYMIPAQFIFVDRFPLNPNKKIDRKALAAIEVATEATAAFVPPETDTEIAIAAIWSDLLGVETIGLHDNFFELGGHSLNAAQLASRLRQILATDLPLRALFDHPTVARLDACITSHETVSGQTANAASAFLKIRSMSDAELLAAVAAYDETNV